MKPTINLAANICRLRKEEHLTQDDLASFLGVTKASVSKWEAGKSYTDIELLPRIATYFGTSVDELMGYAPQLSRADIREECTRLREAFAKETFASAHEKCLEDYERACRKLDFPIRLQGDAFLDKIESWLEDVNIVGTSAPREGALNKKSLLESVTANPAFASLTENRASSAS